LNRSKRLSVGLALAIGLLPIVPSEHVHEGIGPDGHLHVVAHRHAHAHPLISQLHRAASIEDTDPIVTIEPLFGAPAPIASPAPLVLMVRIVSGPVLARHSTPGEFVELAIHGPPLAPSQLRAPPSRA
jgi:hypothetical protein